jgi:hypothetical protein
MTNPLADDDCDDEARLRSVSDDLMPVSAIEGICTALEALRAEISKSLEQIDSMDVCAFRSSRLKSDLATQALPLNLHLQFMANYGSDGTVRTAFNCLTCGCVAAHALKFEHGGLSRLEDNLMTDKARLSQSTGLDRGDKLGCYESLLFDIGHRRLYTVSQALSIAVSGLYMKLELLALGLSSETVSESWISFGFPVVFQGLLSMTNLIGKEKGMIEDCVSTLEALRSYGSFG